jgi:hypothetical protein
MWSIHDLAIGGRTAPFPQDWRNTPKPVKSQDHLTPSIQKKYKVRISYAPLGKIELEVKEA